MKTGYCIKHGHDWQFIEYKGGYTEYRCARCGIHTLSFGR